MGQHNPGQARYKGMVKAWHILSQPPSLFNMPFSFTQHTGACTDLLKDKCVMQLSVLHADLKIKVKTRYEHPARKPPKYNIFRLPIQ